MVTLSATTDTAPKLVAALRTLMGAVRLQPGFVACSVWTTEREEEEGGLLVHCEERWADEAAMSSSPGGTDSSMWKRCAAPHDT